GAARYLRVLAGARHECRGADLDHDHGCRGAWSGDRLGVVEQVPDLASDVPFEASDRFAFGLAFFDFAFDVGTGFGIPRHPAQGDDVDRRVQLPVAAAMQTVTDRFARAGWDRCGAGVPGEARFVSEPAGAGGPADDHGSGDSADAALLEQMWGLRLDQ